MANLRDPKDLGLLLYLSDMVHWPSTTYRHEGETYEQAEVRWREEEPHRIKECVKRASEILNALPH
mgnify:FL=1